VKIPKPIQKLTESFERLPGIGPKTAQRLTYYLLHFPQDELQKFADSLVELKSEVKLCSICKNVTDSEVCSICDDPKRDQNLIALVIGPLDVLAIEKTGFKGVYHVLHGLIDPLNNIGPEEIFVYDLRDRLKKHITGQNRLLNENKVELVLATNTSMEGEATAMYVTRILREADLSENVLKITRIARGLPVGGDVEYADDVTLGRAFDGRAVF
jgi:recombination protein RecR